MNFNLTVKALKELRVQLGVSQQQNKPSRLGIGESTNENLSN